jgi:hypothetical protein
MSRREHFYLGIGVAMVLFLTVFGLVVNPLTQMARWEDSPTLSLVLVLFFLVPFFMLAWSLMNLIDWRGRRNRLPRA